MTKSKASLKAEMKNKLNLQGLTKPPKKVTQGRKKIKIEKIANVNNRQVTFSKRRVGLFKKAAEICILTGAKVALIVQSSGKRVYTFGSPDIDTVLAGYHNGYQIPAQPVPWNEVERQQQKVHNDEYNKLCLDLETEKKKLAAIENGEGLSSEIPWFEKPLDGMSLEELFEILTPLEELQKNVENSLKHGGNSHGTENNNVVVADDDHLSQRSQPLALTTGVDHFSQPLALTNYVDHFSQPLSIMNNVDDHHFSQPMEIMNNDGVDPNQHLALMYNVDSSQPMAAPPVTATNSGVDEVGGGVDDDNTVFDFFPNGDYYEF